MDKYTCKNLVIDPETQGLEDIIGKEVYANDAPLYCLKCANENLQVSILREIRKNDFFPFRVEDPDGRILGFDCIIVKKEEPKPEFIPFKSAEEFTDEYDSANYSVKTGTMENKLLDYGGIWLKEKESGAYYMVTEIWSCGVVIGCFNMRTTKIREGEYLVTNRVTKWKELLEYYIFPDDTPCGKPKENK